MTTTTDHKLRCDHDGCAEWATRGWTAPPDHTPPARQLRACPAHIAWAESRWRAKYGVA